MSQIYSHNSFQMKSQGPEMPPDVYTFGSCRKELSVGFFLGILFWWGLLCVSCLTSRFNAENRQRRNIKYGNGIAGTQETK